MVAASADRRIDFAVSRRRLLLCINRRGAWYSPRHGRIHDGPVRIARNPGIVGNDAPVRNDDPDGKHAGLAAVRYEGGLPDPAFCVVLPGCALSRRRFFHCLAGDFGHGSSWECLFRLRFAPLPPRHFPGLNLAATIFLSWGRGSSGDGSRSPRLGWSSGEWSGGAAVAQM